MVKKIVVWTSIYISVNITKSHLSANFTLFLSIPTLYGTLFHKINEKSCHKLSIFAQSVRLLGQFGHAGFV